MNPSEALARLAERQRQQADATALHDFVDDIVKGNLEEYLAKAGIFARGSVVAVAPDGVTVRVARTTDADPAGDGKFYPTLWPYAPEVNDVVLLVRVANTYLVLGEIRTTRPPRVDGLADPAPDTDIIAGTRLLADGEYTSTNQQVLTGRYPLLGGRAGAIGLGPSGLVNLQSLGEQYRHVHWPAFVRTDVNGQASITLPQDPLYDAPSGRYLVWAVATPNQHVDDLRDMVTATVFVNARNVSVKSWTYRGQPAGGVNVSVLIDFVTTAA